MTLLTEQTPNFVFCFRVPMRIINLGTKEVLDSFILIANIVEHTEKRAREYLSICFLHLTGDDCVKYGLIKQRSNYPTKVKTGPISLMRDPIPVLVSNLNNRSSLHLGVSLHREV